MRIDAAEFCGQLKKILGPDHSDLDEFYAIRDTKIPSSEVVNVAQGFVDRLRVTISKLENGLTSLATGRRVFFGHGQSAVWRELKDFVQDRLGLPWDEFNRDSVAGLATTERLTVMLESAGFAFLILTAEDELADGKTQARPNVIHEVGLFQGKLGFRKAIILLEEGCSEFSNIVGLSQIRFPKGRISACFENVRQVLTREGLIRA